MSGPDAFFGKRGELDAPKVIRHLQRNQPFAITSEGSIAVYRNGVYRPDRVAFKSAAVDLLEHRYRSGHLQTLIDVAEARAFRAGLRIPDHMNQPLLNCANGLVDLRTGELLDHSPEYLMTSQIPVMYDPWAECPTYDQWIKEVVPDQIDDLEEATATMLDPSRTPTKAVFLNGPSRSGKSTFLRLMQAVVGSPNLSAVTLHKLAIDRFAAANIAGKMLNCAADLSAEHVEDLSTFKMMTGQDPIQGDRKYGQQFSFINRALFAFSANEPPTVSESSRAYMERIKPFRFPNSFAGHEDHSIEERMLAEELPGILARWVRAHQRYRERGGYMPTDGVVQADFEAKSDRARQFLDDACTVWAVSSDGRAVSEGMELPGDRCSTIRDVHAAFQTWAAEQGGRGMGQRSFSARLTSMNDVFNVRGPGRKRALNIGVKPESEWGDEPGPCGSGQFRAVSTHPALTRAGVGGGLELPELPGLPAGACVCPNGRYGMHRDDCTERTTA